MLIFTVQLAPRFKSIFIDRSEKNRESIFGAIHFTDSYSEGEYRKDSHDFYSHIVLNSAAGRIVFFSIQTIFLIVFIIVEISILQIDGIETWGMQSEYTFPFITQLVQSFFFWVIFYPFMIYIIFASITFMIRTIKKLSSMGCFYLSPVSNLGGLNQISRFCLHIIKILFFPLLIMFSWYIEIGFTGVFAVSLLLYICLLCFAFFRPVYIIHKALKDTKDRELLSIESNFKKAFLKYKAFSDNPGEEEQRDIEDVSGRLLNYKEMYNLIQSLPIWPYDFKIFLRFLAVILAPIATFVFEMVMNSNYILGFISGLIGKIFQ